MRTFVFAIFLLTVGSFAADAMPNPAAGPTVLTAPLEVQVQTLGQQFQTLLVTLSGIGTSLLAIWVLLKNLLNIHHDRTDARESAPPVPPTPEEQAVLKKYGVAALIQNTAVLFALALLLGTVSGCGGCNGDSGQSDAPVMNSGASVQSCPDGKCKWAKE